MPATRVLPAIAWPSGAIATCPSRRSPTEILRLTVPDGNSVSATPSFPNSAKRPLAGFIPTGRSSAAHSIVFRAVPERTSHCRSLRSLPIPASVLPSLENETIRMFASDEIVRSWAAAAVTISKNAALRISGFLQHDIETHRRARRAGLVEQHVADQFPALRHFAVVLVGVTLEKRIGGEVYLGHQSFVPGRGNQIMDVPCRPVVVMAGHDRLDGILGAGRDRELSAVLVTHHVIASFVIGLPEV